jgi:hypothetical protein
MLAAESMLTAADIERLVAPKLSITPGSCKISPASSTTTLFRVQDSSNGKTILGRIEVRIVADERGVRMISEVRILGWEQWHRPWTPEERLDRLHGGL